MIRRLTRPRSTSGIALLVLLSSLAAPASAHASPSPYVMAATTAGDVDLIGIILAALQILGEIVRLVLAIVNAAI